jgi:hypothetical protein
MKRALFALVPALALTLGASGAIASGRTSDKPYPTARAAAKATAAYLMNKHSMVRWGLGTVRAKDLVARGPIATSATGVSQTFHVATKDGGSDPLAIVPAAKVRKTAAGWVGYTGGGESKVRWNGGE